MLISRLLQATKGFNFKVQANIYNIMRKKTIDEAPLLLYESSTFAVKCFSDIKSNPDALNKYMQLVPFFLERIGEFNKKQFVIKMQFFPNAKSITLDCLGNDGFFQKTVDLENLVPVTFEDYLHSSRRKLFEMPSVIDHEMIYYNTFQDEFYIFDSQGQWKQENLTRPELSIGTNYDERKWFERLRIV